MGIRCFCGASFDNVSLLNTHAHTEGHLLRCGCGHLFKTRSGVEAHQKSGKCHGPCTIKQHELLKDLKIHEATLKCNFCDPSKKPFKDAACLQQHQNDKHPKCPTCNQTFHNNGSLTAQEQRLGHQKATGHCYCAEHNAVFASPQALKDHKRALPHITSFHCVDCDREFKTQQGLDHHLRACPAKIKELKHEQTERAKAAFAAFEEQNLRCEPCNRTFTNLTALRQHKESVKHKPLINISCSVLSEKCPMKFTSPSAWWLHLESGKCKSGMTRSKLYNLVHACDKKRVITYASNAKSLGSITGNSLRYQASIAGSKATDLDEEFDRLSIASTAHSGVILTPQNSDISDLTSEGGIILTPGASDTCSDSFSDSFSSSGVELTPISTATHSHSSSAKGVPLTANDSYNPHSDWSYVMDSRKSAPIPPPSMISSSETVTYENLQKVEGKWPCHLCERKFNARGHLIQHLKSPAHAPNLFHCPPAVAMGLKTGKPEKSFKTLSGFAQHVEAGACDGGLGLLKQFITICQNPHKIKAGMNAKLIGKAS